MKSLRLLALSTCLAVILSRSVEGQTFLRLEGITGSSADTNHPGWIEVQSASPLLSTVTSSSPSGTNRSFSDVCFFKTLDDASPTLALKCAQGAAINSGTVDFADLSSPLARYF